MPGSTTLLNIEPSNSERLEFFEIMSGAGVTSIPVRLQGRVVVQVSGSATDINAIVERASRDPGSGEENWAPAETQSFVGDLSLGMPPRGYQEPAIGWWRLNVRSLDGGDVKVSIIGDNA